MSSSVNPYPRGQPFLSQRHNRSVQTHPASSQGGRCTREAARPAPALTPRAHTTMAVV